jgi:P-type E1-E2 ATPase
MIAINIPGFDRLELEYLVLDYNGTLATHGEMIEGVAERLRTISAHLQVHVVTADTFGTAQQFLRGLPIWYAAMPAVDQAQAKLAYVRKLGAASVCAMGNGRNDRLMLEEAALGVALIQREGGATQAVMAADLVMVSINAALEMIIQPERLVATLRS